MMILLTNAYAAHEGSPLAISASQIEAVFVSFTGQGENCRIMMASGVLYIVRETFQEVMAALTPPVGGWGEGNHEAR